MKKEYTYPQERALQAFFVFYFEKAVFPAINAIACSGAIFFVLQWILFSSFLQSLLLFLITTFMLIIGTLFFLFWSYRRIREERIVRSDLWAWHALMRDLRVTTDFSNKYEELCDNRFLSKETVDNIAEEYIPLRNNALYYLKFYK